jgi:hypothetical protein
MTTQSEKAHEIEEATWQYIALKEIPQSLLLFLNSECCTNELQALQELRLIYQTYLEQEDDDPAR